MQPGDLFAFDLDGTVTECEILPRIAREAGLYDEISRLTRQTLAGEIDFEKSFRLRFALLGSLPAKKVRGIVDATPLNPQISAFIRRNRARCCIVTGNLDVWVEPLIKRLGCRFFSSRSSSQGGTLRLESVLRKDTAIKKLATGHKGRIVAIGESVNDIPMFRAAHLGVAYAGVHSPAPALLRHANHLAPDAASLCRLLEAL